MKHSTYIILLSCFFLMSGLILTVLNESLLQNESRDIVLWQEQAQSSTVLANRAHLIVNQRGHFLVKGNFVSKISLSLFLSHIPRRMIIEVDDCLLALEINKVNIQRKSIPYCNFNRPLEIDLPTYLNNSSLLNPSERWDVSLRINNLGGLGKIFVKIKPTTQAELILRIMQLVSMTLFFFSLGLYLKIQLSKEVSNTSLNY